MSKFFDSHIHFNMKANDIVNDFKEVVSILEGFILILNTYEEKQLFIKEFVHDFSENYPLSAIALSYELFDSEFTNLLSSKNIKLGVKIHPRLSNITVNDFENVFSKLKSLEFSFIIIDCFYYGSNLENHINLELAIFIAKQFKNTKILLAHGGGHKVLEYMLYTRDLKNIYYDFSLSSNYLKNTSLNKDIINFIKFNYKKVFFGSDYPDFTIKQSIDTYNEFMDEAKLQTFQIDDVYFFNILEFLQ